MVNFKAMGFFSDATMTGGPGGWGPFRRRAWLIAQERQRNPSCGCSLRSCQKLGEIDLCYVFATRTVGAMRFWDVQRLQRSKAGNQKYSEHIVQF